MPPAGITKSGLRLKAPASAATRRRVPSSVHRLPGHTPSLDFPSELPGVVFEILKIEGGKPGENPAVMFSVKNKKGEPLEAAKMENLRLIVAWPTADYKIAVEEDARKAVPVGGGIYSYKFNYKIPADASGSGRDRHSRVSPA